MYSDDCEMTVAVMNALTKAVDVKEVSASEVLGVVLVDAYMDGWFFYTKPKTPSWVFPI